MHCLGSHAGVVFYLLGLLALKAPTDAPLAGCIDASGSPLLDLAETTPLPDPPFAGIYSTTKNEAERAVLEDRVI